MKRYYLQKNPDAFTSGFFLKINLEALQTSIYYNL